MSFRSDLKQLRKSGLPLRELTDQEKQKVKTGLRDSVLPGALLLSQLPDVLIGRRHFANLLTALALPMFSGLSWIFYESLRNRLGAGSSRFAVPFAISAAITGAVCVGAAAYRKHHNDLVIEGMRRLPPNALTAQLSRAADQVRKTGHFEFSQPEPYAAAKLLGGDRTEIGVGNWSPTTVPFELGDDVSKTPREG